MPDVHATNADPLEKPAQKPTATRYLRASERREIENEIAVLETTLAQPNVDRPGDVRKKLERALRQLETQTPPDLTPDQRDKLTKEAVSLQERMLSCGQGMPSRDEMKRNPSGTAYKHIAWEKAAKAEGLVARWKQIQLALNKGSDDPDIASVERFRPEANPMVSMLGAQIERGTTYSFASPAYIENFDRAMAPREEDRAELEQLREENAKLRAVLETGGPELPTSGVAESPSSDDSSARPGRRRSGAKGG